MKLPLFLFDGGDLSIFEKAEDLERYVESPDVDGYEVFDASGARFGFDVPSGHKGGWIEVTNGRLVPMPDGEDKGYLEQRIREFLSAIGVEVSNDQDLEEVISTLIGVVGFTR